MKEIKISNRENIELERHLNKTLFDLRMRVLEQNCAFYGCEVTEKDFTILN